MHEWKRAQREIPYLYMWHRQCPLQNIIRQRIIIRIAFEFHAVKCAFGGRQIEWKTHACMNGSVWARLPISVDVQKGLGRRHFYFSIDATKHCAGNSIKAHIHHNAVTLWWVFIPAQSISIVPDDSIVWQSNLKPTLDWKSFHCCASEQSKQIECARFQIEKHSQSEQITNR